MKLIGSSIIFVLDVFTHVLRGLGLLSMGILFGLVFIGAQVASWTGARP